ncbi:Zinc Finger And Btb Domain-Containing Protein 41 [Manis pentadactyla]|nr:Zinc Finger And Btb Domain-Containing Protein 41 [Manis pentadactyla]
MTRKPLREVWSDACTEFFVFVTESLRFPGQQAQTGSPTLSRYLAFMVFAGPRCVGHVIPSECGSPVSYGGDALPGAGDSSALALSAAVLPTPPLSAPSPEAGTLCFIQKYLLQPTREYLWLQIIEELQIACRNQS